MKIKQFLEIFGFQYTASQWEKIEHAIKAQPGECELKEIRETLELEARKYRIVPQLETKTPRDANLAYAKNVIQACEHLKDLLTESAFSRDYSLESLASQSECNAIVNQVKKLQKTAEAAAVNNSSISRKIRRADPRRDEYLKILCDLWVNTIRGPKTTSYKRAGEASGPFVDFLYLTALPVLGQFTRNGAASFIKRWRNGMAV